MTVAAARGLKGDVRTRVDRVEVAIALPRRRRLEVPAARTPRTPRRDVQVVRNPSRRGASNVGPNRGLPAADPKGEGAEAAKDDREGVDRRADPVIVRGGPGKGVPIEAVRDINEAPRPEGRLSSNLGPFHGLLNRVLLPNRFPKRRLRVMFRYARSGN